MIKSLQGEVYKDQVKRNFFKQKCFYSTLKRANIYFNIYQINEIHVILWINIR